MRGACRGSTESSFRFARFIVNVIRPIVSNFNDRRSSRENGVDLRVITRQRRVRFIVLIVSRSSAAVNGSAHRKKKEKLRKTCRRVRAALGKFGAFYPFF